MNKHSPLPWKVLSSIFGTLIHTQDMTAVCDKLFNEDAEFIVEACNNYEALQQENKKLKEALKDLYMFSPDIEHTVWDEDSEYGRQYIKATQIAEELIK